MNANVEGQRIAIRNRIFELETEIITLSMFLEDMPRRWSTKSQSDSSEIPRQLGLWAIVCMQRSIARRRDALAAL